MIIEKMAIEELLEQSRNAFALDLVRHLTERPFSPQRSWGERSKQ